MCFNPLFVSLGLIIAESISSIRSPNTSLPMEFFIKALAPTLQQNGVAERKNYHLLEVVRSLMLTSSTPNRYWGEAVLTASYLINRLPSKVLNYQTSLNHLVSFYPHVHIINSLPPKVFGCIVYIYQNTPRHHKLDPKALKCIFVSYSPTQKGFKC